MALRCGQLVGRTLKMFSSLPNARSSVAAVEVAFLRPYHFLRNSGVGDEPAARALCTPTQHSVPCSCGYHRPGVDKEITEFLVDEIATETKSQKFGALPKLEGFELTTDDAQITLIKKFNDETIKVTVNINHTVDSDESEEELPKPPEHDNGDFSRLKSTPTFKIQMTKGGKTMEFACTMNDDLWINHPNDPAEYNDTFVIDEMLIYEGEKKENTYAVAGGIMDGQLYDLLMNVLDERGVTNEFAEKLVDFCTAYEHKLYIGLLERVKTFFGGK